MTVPVQLISTSNAAHWQLDAACQHADPEMFLPDGKSGRALRDIAQAKLICGICQVQERCLLWPLSTVIKSPVD